MPAGWSTIVVTPVDYRQGGARGPFRVYAADRGGNYLTLTYFNNPGWAKKQFPLGEPKIVSGRIERYGQELQMVHPDYVLPPEEALDLPEREPVYPLSEGLTNHRLGRSRRPGAGAGSDARRMDRAEPARRAAAGRAGRTRWAPSITSRDPAPGARAARL